MATTRRFWRIAGFDGLKPILKATIPYGTVTPKEMRHLLQRLAAQHLTPREIIACSMRRGSRDRLPFLDVTEESDERKFVLSVGQDPHFVASVHTSAQLADLDAL